MTQKFSWERCMLFSNTAEAYLGNHEGKETKLTYAVKRVVSRLVSHQDIVNQRLADIDIDHAYTEKKGDEDVIVYDAVGKLQYTKENQKQRNAARLKYLQGENVEVETYFATQLPTNLTLFQIEAFAGFVIKPEDAERMLAELEANAGEVAEPDKADHNAAGASA